MSAKLINYLLVGYLISNALKNSNLKQKISDKVIKYIPTVNNVVKSIDNYFSINFFSTISDEKVNSRINDFIQSIKIEDIKKIPKEIFDKLNSKD